MSGSAVGVGFTASPGILGNIIRWASNSGVSHCYLWWEDEDFETIMTLGANSNGITMQPLARMALDSPTLYVCEKDLWPGIVAYRYLINEPYGWADLFAMSVVEAERHLLLRGGNDPERQARVIC